MKEHKMLVYFNNGNRLIIQNEDGVYLRKLYMNILDAINGEKPQHVITNVSGREYTIIARHVSHIEYVEYKD